MTATGQTTEQTSTQTTVPRRWPLYLIAAGAAVATWSGWVELGRMTGFGEVHPLPGIWDDATLNTAITLPISVEAYGAYALQVWLSGIRSARTRTFAGRSALASLGLGALGQVAYHVLASAGAASAPTYVTVLVSCLPVLMLGLASALGHMVAHDTADPAPAPADPAPAAPAPADPAPAAGPAAPPAPAGPAAPVKAPARPAVRVIAPPLFPAAYATGDGHEATKGALFREALAATGGDVRDAVEHMRAAGAEPPARGYAYRIRQQWQREGALAV